MVIIHVASLTKTISNGVNNVVPDYARYQSRLADVKFVNITGIEVDANGFQLPYNGIKGFPTSLSAPFNAPDLVVFNGVNTMQYIGLYMELNKRKIPYIINPHGSLTDEALNKKWLKKKIAYFLFFNRFIRHAQAIQCLSDGEKESIKIKTPIKFVGTNGIVDITDKKSTVTDVGMRLLFIGRLEIFIKGFDMLVDAIKHLKEYCLSNKITLDIYGPDILGRKAELCKLIDDADVEEIIKVYPPVFGDEKLQTLRNGDIFIQTSRTEGMPGGILEAMNIGLPVILTEGTRLTEDLADYNYGYNAGNSADGIVNAIKAAYEDKSDWPRKGYNAITYTRDKFDWQKISEQTVAEYKKISRVANR